MKVLDANFLIDYLDGVGDAASFYEASGGRDELWIMPGPAYAEPLVGVGNVLDGDVNRAVDALGWAEVYDVDEQSSVAAARIADEIGPQGPFLEGVDAMVAAVGRELDAPVVSKDGDLTHEETKKVIDVEEYELAG